MDKPFTTKGSEEYFAEREARITSHIDDAKSKIEEIEARVRTEITAISARREEMRTHLRKFVDARNEIMKRRLDAGRLISELEQVVNICDTEMPAIDGLLDEIEHDFKLEDDALAGAEKSRERQLHKHERKKTRFELRHARLKLRKSLFFGDANETKTETQP